MSCPNLNYKGNIGIVEDDSQNLTCPDLNCKGNLVEDDSQSITQVVCSKCGLVVHVYGQLRPAEFNIGNIASNNPSSKFFKYTNDCREYSESYKNGLDVINMLSSRCNVSTQIKSETIKLFESVHMKNEFKYLHTKKKSLLAAGCFYTVARKHNEMLTISYISNIIAGTHSSIRNILKLLNKESCLDISDPGPEDMIETFMGNMLEAKELNTKEMKDRMKKILVLSKECLLSTGLNYQPLLLAVLYISWGSLVVRKQKSVYGLMLFTKLHKISQAVNRTTHKRVKELMKMLCDMANNIPSLKNSKINTKNIFWHVETILQFQNLSMKCSEQDEEEQGLKTYTFVRESTKRKLEECVENGTEEKTFRTSQDLNDPNLTDKDIPEEEIHKYIKTTDEVKRFKNLMGKNNLKPILK